jgi:hypothetical protein
MDWLEAQVAVTASAPKDNNAFPPMASTTNEVQGMPVKDFDPTHSTACSEHRASGQPKVFEPSAKAEM